MLHLKLWTIGCFPCVVHDILVAYLAHSSFCSSVPYDGTVFPFVFPLVTTGLFFLSANLFLFVIFIHFIFCSHMWMVVYTVFILFSLIYFTEQKVKFNYFSCLSNIGCSVAQLWTERLYTPMDCSTSGFPVLHYLLEFVLTHVPWVSDSIQPSQPLSSPFPPPFNLSPHEALFK